MKKEKSQRTKERNKMIVSELKKSRGTEKYKVTVQQLIKGWGISIKQLNRINSKLSSHPTEDILGNVIDKKHHLVHTKGWWIE